MCGKRKLLGISLLVWKIKKGLMALLLTSNAAA
jgi:hypothetical protein